MRPVSQSVSQLVSQSVSQSCYLDIEPTLVQEFVQQMSAPLVDCILLRHRWLPVELLQYSSTVAVQYSSVWDLDRDIYCAF